MFFCAKLHNFQEYPMIIRITEIDKIKLIFRIIEFAYLTFKYLKEPFFQYKKSPDVGAFL